MLILRHDYTLIFLNKSMMHYSCGITLRLLIKINTIAWNKNVKMYSCTSIFYDFRYRPYSCCHYRKWHHLWKNKQKDKIVRNNGLNAWTWVSITISLYIQRWYITNDFNIMYFLVVFSLNPQQWVGYWVVVVQSVFIYVQLKHIFYMCFIFKMKQALVW